MNETVKNVPYNNPALIPIGNYDIEVRKPVSIELENTGSYGRKKDGKWSIIRKIELDDGKEMIMVDLVTLKKVLDKQGMYPDMNKNEVASLHFLSLRDNELRIEGDIVRVIKK